MNAAATPTTTSDIPVATTTPPAIGQYWPEANGIYAGAVAYPDGRIVGLAWANDIVDLVPQSWGEYSQNVDGARSYHNGRANTLAMAAAGCSIAQQILRADGNAWIPSPMEALQLYTALDKKHRPKGWVWTSTQYDGDDAFFQCFEDGGSYWCSKALEFVVRPVRGFVLHHFATSSLGAAPAAPEFAKLDACEVAK